MKNLRRYENEYSHYKQEDQRLSKYKKAFFGYCHCCHKFGHKDVDCRNRGKDQSLRRNQDTNTSKDRIPLSRVPHGNMWRRKPYYKDSEETQISNISEASKDVNEHNNAIDKNDIYSKGKQGEDVNQYTNGYEYDNGRFPF